MKNHMLQTSSFTLLRKSYNTTFSRITVDGKHSIKDKNQIYIKEVLRCLYSITSFAYDVRKPLKLLKFHLEMVRIYIYIYI